MRNSPEWSARRRVFLSFASESPTPSVRLFDTKTVGRGRRSGEGGKMAAEGQQGSEGPEAQLLRPVPPALWFSFH